MSNTVQLAITRRNSNVIARRRRSRKLITPQAFAAIYQGSFEMGTVGGAAYCRFTFGAGRAHAWGGDSKAAYRNTLRNFHHKYTAS